MFIPDSRVAKLLIIPQCTEVRFASFLSNGFISDIVLNPPVRKMAKCTYVQWVQQEVAWQF